MMKRCPVRKTSFSVLIINAGGALPKRMIMSGWTWLRRELVAGF
jgi:hypothetical protein